MYPARRVHEPLRVLVYYDFASSLCYVAHRVMERMARELDELAVSLVWTPIDLTGITGWLRGAPIEGARRANALRVARELGVEVRMPGHWLDSRAAGAAALALAHTPREAAWRERVFAAVHEQGRPIDSPADLAPLARDLGLDLDALVDARALVALAAETGRARDAEVTGVPTFMLGPWPVAGIQEDAVMRSLLGRWARRQRRAAVSPEG